MMTMVRAAGHLLRLLTAWFKMNHQNRNIQFRWLYHINAMRCVSQFYKPNWGLYKICTTLSNQTTYQRVGENATKRTGRTRYKLVILQHFTTGGLVLCSSLSMIMANTPWWIKGFHHWTAPRTRAVSEFLQLRFFLQRTAGRGLRSPRCHPGRSDEHGPASVTASHSYSQQVALRYWVVDQWSSQLSQLTLYIHWMNI